MTPMRKILLRMEQGKTINFPPRFAALELLQSFFVKTKNMRLTRSREEFAGMLLHLESQGCYELFKDSICTRVLVRIAQNYDRMKQVVATWRRESDAKEEQLKSLIDHLFLEYEVPKFLYRVWYAKEEKDIELFFQLTNGASLRQIEGIPIKVTKKMVKHFQTVPDDFYLHDAYRYMQVMGMGGDFQLFKKIRASQVGRNGFEKETFWSAVIQFLVRNSMVAQNKVCEVIDYIDSRVIVDQQYSLKGRTLQSLIRASDEWHRRQYLTYEQQRNNIPDTWPSSGIEEFMHQEGAGKHLKFFFIEELCSIRGLADEGSKMQHCVSSYAYACSNQECTIFSLRSFSKGEVKRLGTIEVWLEERQIVQAKARQNQPISAKAKSLLKRWAEFAELTMVDLERL